MAVTYPPQVIAFEGNKPAPLDADGFWMRRVALTIPSWKEMDKLLQTMKVKVVGVRVHFNTVTVVPAVLQVEAHPYLADNDPTKGINIAAYAATGIDTIFIKISDHQIQGTPSDAER
ncbi:hypothetical protein BDN67DRAFT_966531 [Paxillus ammoniavirescens]|nr:hypothetical protein BDN67DRAFT_966531 [Paxillus ammoniavirescens]